MSYPPPTAPDSPAGRRNASTSVALPVSVEVRVRAPSSGQPARAELVVLDRGPGVPAALRERIFEAFYRLPGASERNGGVGLGLALVKTIAERHGGQVHCEDRVGGGAQFVVSLPLLVSHHAATSVQPFKPIAA